MAGQDKGSVNVIFYALCANVGISIASSVKRCTIGHVYLARLARLKPIRNL